MHGSGDRALPLKHGRAIAEAIPNARLEVLPEAGHLITLEEPEAVSATLLAFLQRE
jgi:pimeloyl-ACP methyl ester carboxylesterase